MVRTRKYFVAWVTLLALAGLPLHGHAASTPGCTVQSTNYLGWEAEELANPWVKLEIVPQIGGRLIQVTFGGHDFLYINPQLKGKVLPLEGKGDDGRNYGGDKIWPLPEGGQDEQHWSGGGNLDSGPFTLQVLSQGPTCAVRLTGPVNPEIGQRYIRDISIGADTPVISFHVVMQNMSGFPQTWSEQTITEYPTSNPSGSENFNDKFWGVTAINPASPYLNGYHVRTGPAENPAFSVSNGTLRVHWNDIMQEVWIDSPSGWLAAVDGMSGYTMVERHHIDPTAEYPSKATIIFYIRLVRLNAESAHRTSRGTIRGGGDESPHGRTRARRKLRHGHAVVSHPHGRGLQDDDLQWCDRNAADSDGDARRPGTLRQLWSLLCRRSGGALLRKGRWRYGEANVRNSPRTGAFADHHTGAAEDDQGLSASGGFDWPGSRTTRRSTREYASCAVEHRHDQFMPLHKFGIPAGAKRSGGTFCFSIP